MKSKHNMWELFPNSSFNDLSLASGPATHRTFSCQPKDDVPTDISSTTGTSKGRANETKKLATAKSG